jgi:hypothetical protein
MSTAVWPSPRDFWEAIQTPQLCFTDPGLRTSKPALDKLGLPLVASGGFASVFKLNAATGTSAKAIRCFRGSLGDRERRYQELSTHLTRYRDNPLASFQYVADGMSVGGRKYPILVMDWIEGSTLDVYIAGILKLPNAKQHLRHLAEQWLHVMSALKERSAAHGDLQHGNILVNDGAYTLVDFDGFFVPSLAGLKAIETGHANYQHPQRRAEYFNGTLDRFAGLVIYVSLIALDRQPQLWSKYHDENLLFKRADFETPRQSALLREIKGLDPECRRLAEVLERACAAPPADCPFLLDLVSPVGRKAVSSAAALGAVTVRTREVRFGSAGPAQIPSRRAHASVFQPPSAGIARPVSPPTWPLLHLCCAWMAAIAAVASFFPELQPGIVVAGVILVAGGLPVLASRRIVGRFTAAWGLLVLMGVGTAFGYLIASAPRAANPSGAEAPAARSLAAPLAPGSQAAPPVISDKASSQVAEHIASARELFAQSEYVKALIECDRALALDRQNEVARSLKAQISNIQDALQGKTH